MGQDGHDRGQKVIASAFADLGFEVEVGALFATPDEVASRAVEDGVDVLGVSSLAAGHLRLVPELAAALASRGRGDIMIVVGGVVPPEDYGALEAAGPPSCFRPARSFPRPPNACCCASAKRAAMPRRAPTNTDEQSAAAAGCRHRPAPGLRTCGRASGTG